MSEEKATEQLAAIQEKYEKAVAVIERLARHGSPSAQEFLARYVTNHHGIKNTITTKKITA